LCLFRRAIRAYWRFREDEICKTHFQRQKEKIHERLDRLLGRDLPDRFEVFKKLQLRYFIDRNEIDYDKKYVFG